MVLIRLLYTTIAVGREVLSILHLLVSLCVLFNIIIMLQMLKK